MSNVHILPGVARIDLDSQCQPQDDLIETLEKLLKDAKSGRTQAVAYAGVSGAHGTFTGWNGGGFTNELMAAITFLQVRFATSANEGDKPDAS